MLATLFYMCSTACSSAGGCLEADLAATLVLASSVTASRDQSTTLLARPHAPYFKKLYM